MMTVFVASHINYEEREIMLTAASDMETAIQNFITFLRDEEKDEPHSIPVIYAAETGRIKAQFPDRKDNPYGWYWDITEWDEKTGRV
jgi:hypothetical protein